MDINDESNWQQWDGTDFSDTRNRKNTNSGPMLIINRGPRQRNNVSYSENEYFRKALALPSNNGASAKSKTIRKYKPMGGRYSHQFLNLERINELEKKAFDAKEKRRVDLLVKGDQFKKALKQRKAKESKRLAVEKAKLVQLRRQMAKAGRTDVDFASVSATTSPEPQTDEKKEWQTIEDEIEVSYNAAQLTKAEQSELEKLLSKGFIEWKTRDFHRFISAMCELGRDNISEIAETLDGKSAAEVREYHSVFWKKHKTIDGWEKLIKRIDDAESKRAEMERYQKIVKSKISRMGNDVLNRLKLVYKCEGKSQINSNGYPQTFDRFLVAKAYECRFDNWEIIKKQTLIHPLFARDWFLRSRTPSELKARCMRLLNMLDYYSQTQATKRAEKKAEKEKKERKEKRKQKKEKRGMENADPNKSKSRKKNAPKPVPTKPESLPSSRDSSVSTSSQNGTIHNRKPKVTKAKERKLLSEIKVGTVIRYRWDENQWRTSRVVAYTGKCEFNIEDFDNESGNEQWCANFLTLEYEKVTPISDNCNGNDVTLKADSPTTAVLIEAVDSVSLDSNASSSSSSNGGLKRRRRRGVKRKTMDTEIDTTNEPNSKRQRMDTTSANGVPTADAVIDQSQSNPISE